MTDGFVKIYGSKLISSSLWNESPEVRLVFIGMLALANRHGVVDVPGLKTLARVLNLTVDYVQKGLAVLEAPDPDSRSPEHDGRRVVPLETGWLLVNYEAYRELRTDEQERGRERVARWRANKRAEAESAGYTGNVTPVTDTADLRSQSSEAENSPPARDPSATGGTYRWCEYFGKRWCQQYNQISYGRGQGDTAASAKLSKLLESLTSEEEAAAWDDRERMLTDFLAFDDQRTRDARHPFSFFVERFNGLRVPALAARDGPPRSQPMKVFVPRIPKKATA